MLPTVDLKGIEIFQEGTWNGDPYTGADLQAIVDAFPKAGFKPVVKAGHADGQEKEDEARKVFGSPSLGYVSRLYLKGKKLLADLTAVPRRFAELIQAGAYKRISSEIYWNYKDEAAGGTYPRLLKAVAFLGAEIPALTSLAEIESLYKKNESGAVYAYDGANEFRIYERDYQQTVSFGPVTDFLLMSRRKAKADVNFVDLADLGSQCGGCKFYIENVNGCTLVEGYIEPDDGCELFEADAQSYQRYAASDLLLKIEKQGDQFCVVQKSDGKSLGCKDNMGDAMKLLGTLHDKMSQNADAHVYHIVKRGSQWCLVAKSTGKTLGCHPSRDKAAAQEGAIKARQAGYQDITVTVEQMREICPPCAERMEAKNFSAIKLAWDEESKSYAFPGGMPEAAFEALCGKFSPDEGFRTRCMDSKAADNVSDAGAFCNALKVACKNKDLLSSGQRARQIGGSMDEKEKLQAEVKRLQEEQEAKAKEYEAKIAEAEAKAREAADKEKEQLEQRLRKMESDRREERIAAWVDQEKKAGKIAPVEEPRIVAFLKWLPDEKVAVKFSQDGKEHSQTPSELFKEFISKRPSIFKVLSKDLGGEDETEMENAGDEINRRVEKLRAERKDLSYTAAHREVCKADPDLARRYNELKN